MLIRKEAWHQQNSKFTRIKWNKSNVIKWENKLLYKKYKNRSNKDKLIRQHQM